MDKLKPFQQKFRAACHSDKFNLLALSTPRGNGKSYMAARLIYDLIKPDSPHFVNGDEVGLMAASLNQARIVFRYLRDWLEETGLYSWQDSSNKLGITLKAKRGKWKTTKVTAFSSDGKTAMGIVKIPWVVCDEPGAWEVNKGQLMYEALIGALGKPGSRLRILFIGTLAPARAGWWIDLVRNGTNLKNQTYVYCLQGNRKTWDNWNTIKKANPLATVDPNFRKQLLIDRDKARNDTRLKAFFLSYRLNVPTADESEILLNADEWEACLNRPVGDDDDEPVIGIDMGSRRSWSAAVALFPSGRVECFCLAGDESIAALETRDLVPSGTYQELIDDDVLLFDEAHKVPRAEVFTNEIARRWPTAWTLIGDRFRADELEDYWHGEVIIRITMWKQASEDIRSLRSLALDGELSIEHKSRKILTHALMHSLIENDSSGNSRMVKTNMRSKTARDDAGAALLMAAGEYVRQRTEAETAQEVEFISI